MSIDPVCGMEVNEAGAPMAEYQGNKYYFCCEGCKKAFIKEPGKYLSKAAHQGDSHGHHMHGHGGHHH